MGNTKKNGIGRKEIRNNYSKEMTAVAIPQSYITIRVLVFNFCLLFTRVW